VFVARLEVGQGDFGAGLGGLWEHVYFWPGGNQDCKHKEGEEGQVCSLHVVQ